MPPTDDELALIVRHFDQGFRDLGVRDLLRANEADVRMGTFILCVAFLDWLSLANSAGLRKAGSGADKWRHFFRSYFDRRYARIGDSYTKLRSLLLHNYSPAGLAFNQGPENADLHLQIGQPGDVLFLHRESFVEDVVAAYHAFRAEVEQNDELRPRVLRHLERHPTMNVSPVQRREGPAG